MPPNKTEQTTEVTLGHVASNDQLGEAPKRYESPLRPHRTPTRSEVERLMKRCQIGVGGRSALDDAHSIMADCYGTLGLLMLNIEWRDLALERIYERTAATPGMTDAELGRSMAWIGDVATDGMAPNA
jgi:hypothetical protein